MNMMRQNPYIGPRTFQRNEGHLFFGREREARDLIALVASEQLVVFYAQSGAGKSSIVNTRLISSLEGKGYEVLPVGRVSGDTASGLDVDNIYIYNLIRNLEQHEAYLTLLSKLSLSQFLAHLNIDEKGYFYDDSPVEAIPEGDHATIMRRAVIIDQFEELFSTHPEAWKKRAAFFEQLAQAMQDDPQLWVVLVMREDYIAALDPYAHLLPGGLRVRYYMQRLGKEAALRAVRSPVENLRPYADGVAEKLVEDLSSIKVQQSDGTTGFQPGQYIEPVQMQVVCYGLWDNLPQEGIQITEKDLLEVGDVDEALGKYFAARIAGVAKTKNVKERLIREWIEKKLIAPGGIRNVVLQDTTRNNSEISDDVVQALQSDLVRAEKRGGATWYELTHDRLVGPILANNKKWFDENLSPLQRQARLWNDQERNESWLLRDQALAEVEKWARENKDELTGLENEFIEACRKQQAQLKLKEQANSARRAIQFTVVALSLTFIAVVAAVFAFRQSVTANAARKDAQYAQATAQSNAYAASTAEVSAVNANATAQASEAEALMQKQRAENAADQALAGNLAAQADSLKNTDYRLALLLGLEAYQRSDSLLTRTTLFQLLQFTPYQRKFGLAGTIGSVAVSPDGTLIATASCGAYDTSKQKCISGGIQLFQSGNIAQHKELSGPGLDFGIVYSLAFHQFDKRLILAAAGCVPTSGKDQGCADKKGEITIWDVSDFNNPHLLSDTNAAPETQTALKHTGLVKTIAFSPDGSKLISGSYDQAIILWDIDISAKPVKLQPKYKFEGHSSFVNSVVFSPDGKFLVSAGDDKKILIWDISQPDKASHTYLNHNAPVTSVAFSSKGDSIKFASASNDQTVILWNWTSDSLDSPKILRGHTGYVTSIAFNADGTRLASAGFDNSIILWNTETGAHFGEQIGPALNIHSGAVNSIAFGAEQDNATGSYLISGSDDRTIIKWNLSSRNPVSHSFEQTQKLSSDSQLEAKNDQYDAIASGQQINVNPLPFSDSFLVISGFNTQVSSVGWDANQLLSVDQNQLSPKWITEWVIDPNIWVTQACAAVQRNLINSEWAQYLPNQPYRKTCEQYP